MSQEQKNILEDLTKNGRPLPALWAGLEAKAEAPVQPLAAGRPQTPLAAVRQNMKYKLQDLLAECDAQAPLTEEDLAWLNDPPVEHELY
ncbi:hypothetical protein FACS189460_1850 [Deltaproteobacteria bacterium]|nr:hypothetical protein FACS189460_1850 [Deltaproteobacteria bacterium]